MNPKEWIGKSQESAFQATAEVVQSIEESMGRDELVIEDGDKLPFYGHWLYPYDATPLMDEFIASASEEGSFYWHSGSIEREKHLFVGDKCKRTSRIKNIQELKAKGTENQPSWLISLDHQIVTSGKVAVTEEQHILITNKIQDHENPKRINFDPDWEHEVTSGQLTPVQKLKNNLAGHPVSGFLSHANDKSLLPLQGSSALVLLLESFNYHFESREVVKVSYQSCSYRGDAVSIAGEDSDSFVTSLRMINNRKQVLFGADIRWSYTWT